MNILELTNFSAGGCGVWARAREEAIRLSRLGHDVTVFSSREVKGQKGKASSEEDIEGVHIKRFPSVKLGGESFMAWPLVKEAIKINPDVIIAHNYRHLHTLGAIRIARALRRKGRKCKVFLVTHAPFVEGNITRKWFEKLIVGTYDKTVGKMTINSFDKILTISKWERPYLINIGANRDKIKYIPNGIPEEFFSQKYKKEENKILFLSRIAPKKKLETLIEAMAILKDKKVRLEIVGPKEEPYASEMEKLVKKRGLEKRVSFLAPVYNVKKKIEKIDSAKIFVLPSRVEGMPQALIEAMARKKIVIGSDSMAIRDIIKDKKNGYLFTFDDSASLAATIDMALKDNKKQIKSAASISVRNFDWGTVSKIIDKEINS